MMLDRGHRRRHAADQARLATLRRSHHPVRDLYRLDQLPGAAVRDSELVNEFNVVGLVDNATETLRAGAVPEARAGQSRRAAALHCADGSVSAGAVMMLRQPNWTSGGRDRAVAGVAANRLEPARLPGRHLVLQPVLLAGAVRIRLMVRARRRPEVGRGNQSPGDAVVLHRLSDPRARHDDGRQIPDFAAILPQWLNLIFNPNDKTNLAPYRFIHFVVIVIMVIRFVPKDWPGLEWKIFDPLVVCGQQSLAVFCVGVFLSFVGHFELSMSSGSLFAQTFVSVTGIAIMTIVAYYISWSKRQDKPLPKLSAPKAA